MSIYFYSGHVEHRQTSNDRMSGFCGMVNAPDAFSAYECAMKDQMDKIDGGLKLLRSASGELCFQIIFDKFEKVE